MVTTRARMLVLLALSAGAVALVAVFGADLWGLARFDGEALGRRVEALGPLAPAALFVLMVVQCVIAPIPSEPLMAAAGYLYGARLGALLSWAGIVLGAGACFALARRYGRPFVLRFVKAKTLASFDAALGSGPLLGFGAVLFLRVFAFTSFDVVSYAFGLSKIPFRWFVLATALGGVPKAVAFSALGAGAASTSAWLGWMIALGTLGALGLAPFLFWMRRRAVRN